MTDTKAKIRAAALKLFNEQGIDVITIRHIAKELDISHGNLQYHYKNSNDIIQALFDELTSAVNNNVQHAESHTATTFADFCAEIEAFFGIIWHYRFIFLQFIEVTRRVPGIKTTYNSWDQPRQQQMLRLFHSLQQQNVFRTDIPDHIWKGLLTQMYIMLDFWLSHNEIKLNLKGKKAVRHYSGIFCNLFYPYLTPKGREQADNNQAAD
ncbi:TetR family transcriptional regulator [Chitinophaga sp. Mgbs1]|uniref:TetR family transcriptional regulator n=1 Tax=Chitinophaga solisilvae TaxID=1233460 RepID=A0A3S1CVX4_9BACT|nr:TetR family transcriptional regulator [Chitinophaga solisilvae]